MSNGDDVLRSKIEELLDPSATDVRRAKRTILAALEDGRTHRSAWLLATAAESLGAPAYLQPLELVFQEQPQPEAITADAQAIVYGRSRLAAMRGLGELAVLGIVMPASDPGGEEERRHEPLLIPDETFTVGITHPGGRSGVRARVDRPMLAASYMLVESGKERWYLEPDLFLAEIGDLDLTERANRALREALASFRRGLFLACGSLLGVVSEAAWYSVAGRIQTSAITSAMEEQQTARLQRLTAEELKRIKGLPRSLPEELLAHAALLREIRNYGVHPNETRDDLEHWFTEEACGLLILQTHHYLTRLAGAAEGVSGRAN